MNRIYQKIQTREGLMALGSIALVFAMFALLGLGAFAFARSAHNDSSDVGTITVSGSGEVSAAPDVANFTGTISVDAKTMAEAEKSATAQESALIAKLSDAGIAKDDIKTTSYNAYPKYENRAIAKPTIECFAAPCPTYPVSNSVIVGYTVSESISIKVRDLDKAGDIAKVLTDANVSSVSGPDFAIDKPEQVQNEARDKAIQDAKEQAELLAKQLGVHLKGIVDFQVSNGGPIYPMAYATKAMDSAVGASAPAPSLPAGQTDVKTNVTITYRIK
ncbi:MAG: hypothetical protein JWM20_981 [Patescibacteria group bacterium]|nr:hypothetical protein [Patescibacteria group bacterium]